MTDWRRPTPVRFISQALNRYLEAWEDIGLIEAGTWRGSRRKEGVVVILEAPDGLELPVHRSGPQIPAAMPPVLVAA